MAKPNPARRPPRTGAAAPAAARAPEPVAPVDDAEAPARRGRRRRGGEEPAPAAAPAPLRPPTARSPRVRAKAAVAPAVDDKPGMRARASQRMLKIGFMRRRYAKRLIRYIDKSKEKGRPLPAEFADLERFLAQVPKAERAKRFEEALVMQQQQEAGEEVPIGRQMRRAAANQQRRSGKNPAGYRPGSAPRSLQPRPKGSRPR